MVVTGSTNGLAERQGFSLGVYPSFSPERIKAANVRLREADEQGSTSTPASHTDPPPRSFGATEYGEGNPKQDHIGI